MANLIVQAFYLLYLVLIYATGDIDNKIADSFLFNILALNIISIFSFSVLRVEKNRMFKRQYLRIIYVFLIGYVIVHFQAYVDLLLGNLDRNNLFIWIDKTVVAKSLVLCSIGMVSLFLGYSLSRDLKRNGNLSKPIPTVFLFRLSAVLLVVFFATVNPAYLSGHYGEEGKGGLAGYSSFIFECSIVALIIIHSRNLILKGAIHISILSYIKELKLPIGLLALYLMGVMVSGDRGPIIYCSLSVIFGYIYVSKKKFSFGRILLFIFIASLFITVLGLARRADKSLDFTDKVTSAISDESVESRYYPTSFSIYTKELATSIRTVHMAVSNVPSRFSHFYGLFAFQDLLLIVPSAKGSFISMTGIPKYFTSSAQFLTFTDLGSFATWGVGTSCLADVYLDFGMIGIIVVFFVFGFFLRKLEFVILCDSLGSIPIVICAFLLFSYSIYIPRATLLYGLSKFLYVLALIYLPIIFTKNRHGKKV